MKRFRRALIAKPSVVDPLRAEIPLCDPLHGEIFGVDDQSYFHIGFSEAAVYDLHHALMATMEHSVREGKGCLPRHMLKRVGSHCIVECRCRRGGVYARGKILGMEEKEDSVRCMLIDDFRQVNVHISQVFYTNNDVLRFPKFSLKCQLEDMDCFLGYPYLKNVFSEFMKGEWKPGVRHCTVKVLDPCREVPVVQLITSEGKSLTSLLQEYIPILSKLDYPLPGVPTKGKLVYCNASGKMWFQFWGEHELSHVIKSRLQQYNSGHIPVKPTPQVNTWSWWKNYFFSGPGELFIVKDTLDNRCYRVRVHGRNLDGTVQVNFIDYGYTEDVYEETLIPAHRIDPNLSFISPQCLAIQFVGTQQCNEENPFDVARFWKYLRRQPVSILIKDYGGVGRVSERLKGLIAPEADIFVRSMFTSLTHPGYSLSETLGLSSTKVEATSENPAGDDSTSSLSSSSETNTPATSLYASGESEGEEDEEEKFTSIDLNNNISEEKDDKNHDNTEVEEQAKTPDETEQDQEEEPTSIISLLEEPLESKRSTWVDWVLEQIDNPESSLLSSPSSLPSLGRSRRRRRLIKF